MALTASELRELRRDIGDIGNPPDLSDAELQAAYERDNDCYRVYALLQRLARHEADTPEFDRIERLLNIWREMDGCSGGVLRTGLIDLGIDSECTESEWS